MLRSREKFPKIEKEPKSEEKELKEIKGEEITTGEVPFPYMDKFIAEQEYPDYSKRAGITPEAHRKKFDEILESYDISIAASEMYSEGNFEIKKELGDRVKKILEENAKGKDLDELRKILYGAYAKKQEALPDKEKDKKSKYKGGYLAYLVQKNIGKHEIRDFLKYKSIGEVIERLANSAIFRELETIRKEKEAQGIPFPYGKPKQITEKLLKEKRIKDAKKVLEFSNLLKKEPPA